MREHDAWVTVGLTGPVGEARVLTFRASSLVAVRWTPPQSFSLANGVKHTGSGHILINLVDGNMWERSGSEAEAAMRVLAKAMPELHASLMGCRPGTWPHKVVSAALQGADG